MNLYAQGSSLPDFGPRTDHAIDPRNEPDDRDPIELSGPEYMDRIDDMSLTAIRDELRELREAVAFHIADAASWKAAYQRLARHVGYAE